MAIAHSQLLEIPDAAYRVLDKRIFETLSSVVARAMKRASGPNEHGLPRVLPTDLLAALECTAEQGTPEPLPSRKTAHIDEHLMKQLRERLDGFRPLVIQLASVAAVPSKREEGAVTLTPKIVEDTWREVWKTPNYRRRILTGSDER